MDTRFEEPRHPIGVASERTGLSTDVIRAWERRYGATEPARDESGQRLYSDAEIERLRLLRRATEGGRSISQVASLPLEELTELVRGDEEARAARVAAGEAPEDLTPTVRELVRVAKALDGATLERSLRALMLDLGFVRFAEEVAAPLLRRLGEEWHAGEASAAQEHLASAALRRVLETAQEVQGPDGSGPLAVVGTLQGDRHETGALTAAAAVRLAGWRVVYLGTDLPVSEHVDAVRATGAQALCVSVTFPEGTGRLVDLLRELRTALPDRVDLYVGGPAIPPLRDTLERYGIRCPGDLSQLRDTLRRRGHQLEGV